MCVCRAAEELGRSEQRVSELDGELSRLIEEMQAVRPELETARTEARSLQKVGGQAHH